MEFFASHGWPFMLHSIILDAMCLKPLSMIVIIVDWCPFHEGFEELFHYIKKGLLLSEGMFNLWHTAHLTILLVDVPYAGISVCNKWPCQLSQWPLLHRMAVPCQPSMLDILKDCTRDAAAKSGHWHKHSCSTTSWGIQTSLSARSLLEQYVQNWK